MSADFQKDDFFKIDPEAHLLGDIESIKHFPGVQMWWKAVEGCKRALFTGMPPAKLQELEPHEADKTADPEALLPAIRNAGAIFMGPYTSEALGDYCAGPNHVLPTARSARFSSPLGVYDFQKCSSLIMCSEQGVQELGRVSSVLARGESLTAHARSAEMRLSKE